MLGGGVRVIGKKSQRLKNKQRRRRRGVQRRRIVKKKDECEVEDDAPEVDIENLPEVDIGEKQERCVLLLGHEDPKHLKLIAWYPGKGEVGLVPSSSLMPHTYRPLDSCGGFVCGIHNECLMVGETFRKLRVAVFNPSTRYEAELPPLDMRHRPLFSPEDDLSSGRLRLTMTPPPLRGGQSFCVHFTTSSVGEHQVYSFNSRRWEWEAPTSFSGEQGGELVGELVFRYHRDLRSYDVATKKWSGIAAPGGVAKAWDADFPMPERFSACPSWWPEKKPGYYRMFPFRYGDKIMAAGIMTMHQLVLMELREGWKWEVVTTACAADFLDSTSAPDSPSALILDCPVVRGDLLVIHFCRPAAFNLKHHKWMQLPASLAQCSNVALHCACVYEP